MLLGCCHCDNPITPSSTSSSSGSSVSSGPSTIDNTCAVHHCLLDIAAVNYRLDFNWAYNTPNTTGSCALRYTSNLLLSFVPSLSSANACVWKSSVIGGRALFTGGAWQCTNMIGNQAAAIFVMAQGGAFSQLASLRYTLRLVAGRYQDHPSLPAEATLIYGSNLSNSAAGTTPTTKINCLSSISLPLASPASPVNTTFALYANYSAKGTVPTSVSLVPE